MPTCIDCGASGWRFSGNRDRRCRRDRCAGCAFLRAQERRQRRAQRERNRTTHCVVCGAAFFDPAVVAYMARYGHLPRGHALFPELGRARSDRVTCSPGCRQRASRARRRAEGAT